MTQPADTPAIDVSVIIPAWKAAAFIKRAIDSALMSEGVSVEVIAVDDASPDGTYDALVALAAADSRVRAERLAENGGPSAARNRAIALARGRYIAVLDADDAIAPDRLRRLVDIADRTGAGIVADNMTETDAAGHALGTGPFLKHPRFAAAQDIGLETWVRFNQPMGKGDCLGYLKPLFRRSALEETGLRYDPGLRNSEDYYLVASLLAAGVRMTYTAEPGYLYARAEGSVSHRLTSAHTGALISAETDFQTRYAASPGAAERQALGARMKQLRDVDQFVRATEAIKARRPGGFLRTVMAKPDGWPFMAGWFARIAWSKATGRRAA